MKKLVLLLCLSVFSTLMAQASVQPWNVKSSVEVGKQPLAIFPTSTQYPPAYIVYCGGNDAGWDDTLNVGVDEAPSLWLVGLTFTLGGESAKATGEKIADLSFGTAGYPFRPAFDGNMVYAVSKGVLSRYSIAFDGEKFKVNKDSLCLSTAIAVSKLDSLVFLSEKENYTNPGHVRVFNLESKTFVDTIQAFPNVQQTLTVGSIVSNGRLYILSEGISGATESTIIVADILGNDIVPVDTIYLGISGSNHMAVYGNNMIVTDNFSEDLKVINLGSNEVIRTIPLPGESPRESFFFGNSCMVSTFSGKVLQIDYENGTVQNSADVHGKAEAMYADTRALLVASSLKKDSWDKDSIVDVFIYVLSADEGESASVVSYPNPVTNSVTLGFPAQESILQTRLTLSDATGNQVYGRILNQNENSKGAVTLSADELQLPNGAYFAEIQSGNSVYRCKFIISR